MPQRTARRTERAASNEPIQREAENHRRTRRAHLTEIAEDYVEVIADLIDTTGEARATDIARRLGVTHVTVVKTVARLAREGLVTSRPYRSIFLTDAGRHLATESRKRHALVLRFLLALGVDDAVAHADAEGIEHHVSQQTLAAFERFCMNRTRTNSAT
ncbi:MAG: manganese-binding transcriptional regulator MntR [Phycisphaerae bacterium]